MPDHDESAEGRMRPRFPEYWSPMRSCYPEDRAKCSRFPEYRAPSPARKRPETVDQAISQHQPQAPNRGIGNTRLPQIGLGRAADSGKIICFKAVALRRPVTRYATRGNANAFELSPSGNRERLRSGCRGRTERGIGNGRSGNRERAGTGQREQTVGGTRTPTRANSLIFQSISKL
jgi:hypothetical protein